MDRKCVVPNCKSGYDSGTGKMSMFSIPKNKSEDWQKAIGLSDLSPNIHHLVCEKHFPKKDIIKRVKRGKSTYSLKVPKLSENAIPSILPKKYDFRPRPPKNPVISWKRIKPIKNMNVSSPALEEQMKLVPRKDFMEKLKENRAYYINSGSLSKKDYDNIMAKIAKVRKRDTHAVQKLKSQYEIIIMGGRKKLAYPSYNNSKDIQIYVHDEEIFDILQKAHISSNHAGALKLSSELKKNYKNICLNDIITYNSLCPLCSNITNRKLVIENTIKPTKRYCTELSKSCHIGILDYQSNPDREFQFILMYQNDLTKYNLLKPLRTFDDIYTELCDIFAFIGVPTTIHSNLDHKFMNNVIKKINLGPEQEVNHIKCEEGGCRIINTEELSEHLEGWMDHNNTTKWSEGLRFIQLIMNRDFHEDLNGSPYETLFKLSTNDAEVNAASISNGIKTEKIEIFSYVCEACGYDGKNEETFHICGVSKSLKNETF